jgi:hypothetical protein
MNRQDHGEVTRVAEARSHAQHEQCNRAEADYQDHERDGVVIEPMPAAYMHDDFPEERLVKGHFFPADGQRWLSPSLVALVGWEVQTRL